MSRVPHSEAGFGLLQRLRDGMVRVLTDRAGPFIHRTLGDFAEEVRGTRRISAAEHAGREQVEAALRRQDQPSAHGDRGGAHDRIPDNVAGLLARVHDSGLDPETAAGVERSVLDRYQRERERREQTLRRDFLHNRSRDLRARGETEDADATAARIEADKYVDSARGREMIDRFAAGLTTEWADRIGLTQTLREMAISPRAYGRRSIDAAIERHAKRGERGPLSKILDRAVDRIENSNAHPRAIDKAMKVLHDKHHQYRREAVAETYRAKLLQERAVFTRDGFPPRVADALAQRKMEAIMQSGKVQRAIDNIAANHTNHWFNSGAARTDRSGIDIVDRLAEQYDQAAAANTRVVERITAVSNNIASTQQRLDRLLERSPDLADKGAARWQEGIDAARDRAVRLSDTVEARTVAGSPLSQRELDEAVRQAEIGITGYSGEIRMAEKLDNIHELGPLVDVSTPTGGRMASEVDIVTDGGRAWHEVKNANPRNQLKQCRELEAQVRKQLAISHMNQEYWVDGKPPELKMHFMRGVDPTVKSRLEAIRIEDENGRIIDSHRVEIIDES